MVDDRTQLREARRLLNSLNRVCRQMATYLDGISAMDEKKMKRVLQDAVRESDRFLAN